MNTISTWDGSLNELNRIMSVQIQTIPSLFKNQKNSLAIRIWHWLTFIGFTASLVTVLLGSTLFKTKSNISTVTEEVAHKGGVVTEDQAWSVAHAFSDKLWNTHKIIGFVLCFLLLSRVIIELFQPNQEKLTFRIRTALNFHPLDEKDIMERNHYILVKRGYLVFYLLFLIMALTGLVLAFEDVEYLKPIHKTANSIHSFVQYGIYAYILVHLIGVVRADIYKTKGIVSGMINGSNERS
jgi:Ni/Fe-hydrogenase 1 B-type cytochrome subunit